MTCIHTGGSKGGEQVSQRCVGLSLKVFVVKNDSKKKNPILEDYA